MMRFIKSPNLTIALLFLYTTGMYIYLFPRNTEMSDIEKWSIVGVSYATLVLLWFLLRRRQRLRREREEQIRSFKKQSEQ
ncbi:MAG: hypothetical protein IKA41_06230 [Bacteroidaceae bacterium]|nr:hypothetical protein [Bacteroidaceae bacterium]